ncbi:formylglycine-generating enzyme family protein [Leptolyngbya sp. CCNP1308]|uniref:formylglycine-generating enzyme family protein n=1 Tax=Leptolyngbya sp. CCNP1308 TaxID=3110255 RepID=UPI002B1ED58D|nr:formylglycine-generating enzyme family protein [Leptolyngbya sp. CCNP1308]MEA5447901.1 formylglycine-generating enzyme family protein [Leptolyngbya sp. CCNP1308]
MRQNFPLGNFNCWGLPERAEPSFLKTNVSDLVVFAPEIGSEGGVKYFGFVKAICPVRCYAASRILRPETPDDRLFPFLFFFDTEKGCIPWSNFLEELQYKSNWNPRGWYRAIDTKRFSKWGSKENYAQHLRQSYEFSPIRSKHLVVERQLQRKQCFIEPAIQLDLVLVPGGTFTMGSSPGELGRWDDEGPQREVSIRPFLMGRYPVTQAQWKAIANRTDLKVNTDLDPDLSKFKGDDHPVEQISWFEALEFCERLSCLTNHTYRLPTEAEWEYACRAGTETPFHFGETITTDLANYRGEDLEDNPENFPGHHGRGPKGVCRKSTTPVNHFHPLANAFGLCDMHGNVWEWCLDNWHDNYEGAPTDGSVWLAKGKEVGRVQCGGSWDATPRNCRSASRIFLDPFDRGSPLGFRRAQLCICRGATAINESIPDALTSHAKSCLGTPDSAGRMSFASTVWPFVNRGYVIRIWYQTSNTTTKTNPSYDDIAF